MFVVFFVAGVTFDGRILECRLHMTLLAFDRGVLTQQWKCHKPVIEAGTGPTRLVVALLADAAFLTLMNIVCPMTGYTLRLKLLLIQIAGMTGFTGNFAMGAPQGVLR